VDQISIAVTGRVVRNPFTGTTRNGKPMTTFTLAAYLPPRTPGSDGTTRWFKVFCFDTLATNVAASLVDGDRVTVRASDCGTRTWTPDGGGKEPRAEITLTAWDVAASMTFETLITAKAARGEQAEGDPWASDGLPHEEQANREVLAGVTRNS
jgi:single-stranded DNA-binding protein